MHHVVSAVYFMESTYRVNEDNEVAQVELVLSKPLSTDIAVQVISVDDTAMGKWINFVAELIPRVHVIVITYSHIGMRAYYIRQITSVHVTIVMYHLCCHSNNTSRLIKCHK